MEQTTRKRTSERAPAEQEQETPEAEPDREAQLAEIDELLDEIDEVLEDNEGEAAAATVAHNRAQTTLSDDSPDAELARLGLYGPSDLDEAIAEELAESVAAARELEQQEMLEWFHETNPPCSFCGQCPVHLGCPFQSGDGTHGMYSWDGSVEIF